MSETSKLPASLAVQATLVSPKSTKFDLYAYVDKKDDSLACITPSASSASTLGSVDHVELDWSDNWFGNDSRTVAIEVRSRNGSCDASSTWSLLVSNVDHSAKGF